MRFAATQREVGNVQLCFAEDRADTADDAGDILVANDDERACEFGFDVDAVVAQQSGRPCCTASRPDC